MHTTFNNGLNEDKEKRKMKKRKERKRISPGNFFYTKLNTNYTTDTYFCTKKLMFGQSKYL